MWLRPSLGFLAPLLWFWALLLLSYLVTNVVLQSWRRPTPSIRHGWRILKETFVSFVVSLLWHQSGRLR